MLPAGGFLPSKGGFMKYALIAFGAFFCSAIQAQAFDKIGPPNKVHCSAYAKLAKEPITEITDINKLLEDSTSMDLGSINPECHKYNGKVVGCEGLIEKNGLHMRYAFNTQNGNIDITDPVTGLTAGSHWFNQYEIVKTGYITKGIDLTSLKGGLMGNSRAFAVHFSCQAYGKDWE